VAAVYAPNLKLTGVPALRIALEERGYERGYREARAVAAALARRDPAVHWEEAELNDWGYRLLSSGRAREGLEVLKLTVALFPGSANAYDSVAEAYAATGARAAALDNYQRSLALDPSNTNAAQQIQRLTHAAQSP
jgi:tetratricopeptide (TPR) repeat protein